MEIYGLTLSVADLWLLGICGTLIMADNQVKHKEIAEKIIGLFEMNPYFSISDPIFPLRALSYGCGKWAVIVSKDFIDEFDVKLDMSKLTDIFREQLNTAIK